MKKISRIYKEGDTRGRKITNTGRASFLIVFVMVSSILLLLTGEDKKVVFYFSITYHFRSFIFS